MSGVSILNIHEPDFQALFPNPAICALGALPTTADCSGSKDTLYCTSGAIGRLQSATYEGVRAAAGLFAYVYQLDCTERGLVDRTIATIPLTGAMLDPIFGVDLTYIATQFDTPTCLQAIPPPPVFTGNLSIFNLSGFEALGGTTGNGFTTASVGIDVEVDSGVSLFWSGSLLVFVTDRKPVTSHVTVAVEPDACTPVPSLNGSDQVVACVPTPAPEVEPDPGDIIPAAAPQLKKSLSPKGKLTTTWAEIKSKH